MDKSLLFTSILDDGGHAQLNHFPVNNFFHLSDIDRPLTTWLSENILLTQVYAKDVYETPHTYEIALAITWG